jgi:hypothetical protein
MHKTKVVRNPMFRMLTFISQDIQRKNSVFTYLLYSVLDALYVLYDL